MLADLDAPARWQLICLRASSQLPISAFQWLSTQDGDMLTMSFTNCRSQGFALVPQHLLEVIVAKFGSKYGQDGLLALKLVSKAWKAAVMAHKSIVSRDIEASGDLFRACKIWPGMSTLKLDSPGIQFHLYPALGCANLKTVVISNSSPYYQEVTIDLPALPSSLRDLSINDCNLDANCFEDIICTQLTKLSVNSVANTTEEICSLLKRVPNLKVNLCFHPATQSEPQMTFCKNDCKS